MFLMNEAPGPSEALVGIPSFGQQGANIFHALRKARISWATQYEKIVWPIIHHDKISQRDQNRYCVKSEFLVTRAQHITCSNAYPHWPKTSANSGDFVDPDCKDVVSEENLERIRQEINPNHYVLLLCGEFAYQACYGSGLAALHTATREGTPLTVEEISKINDRLGSCFAYGWYMGHTRRWSLNSPRTSSSLLAVAEQAGWKIDPVTNNL